ncbi:MAG: GNAT family N-acetyltransferase [Chlamydiales bacterium]|nr:GNAT family N-acetyltransferase [Chlamydiales bacterium]
MERFIIEEAGEEDLAYMLSLAGKEGWAPGLYDAQAFYAQDPHGFFIGKLNGKPIGCISNVCYDPYFAFLGFYIVEKPFRKKGYGIQLWNHAMEYAKGRSIGLDGVLQEQANYKKSGFSLYYRNIRYEILPKTATSLDTVTVEHVPFELLRAYDEAICGLNRDTFLKAWLAMPNAKGVAVLNDNKVEGYGIIRTCKEVYKIGPLFADNSPTAYKIFNSLQGYALNKPIYLDVPECNPLSLQIANTYSGKKIFETARMYTSTPPKILLDKVYGITSFELG